MTTTKIYEPDLTLFKSEHGPISPHFEEVISLDGRIESSLNWDVELNRAHQLQENGSLILWDLQLEPLNFKSCFDQLCYSSAQLAIETFIKQVLPQFDNTFGVIISKLNGVPLDLNEAENSSHYFDVISHELHRRGALFPEELMVFALFDLTSIQSPSEQAYLFSIERFAHIQLGLKGAKVPLFGLNWENGRARGGSLYAPRQEVFEPTLGVCLPRDSSESEKLDKLFLELNDQGREYRIICEEQFSESWYGLDEIIVFLDMMDPVNGPRLCEGFEVSGGIIKRL
ncbi:MAG: hypothetical protein P0S95_06365 [Rhabdochlamydiaceae bacterium]|nr:hypothetical protein [Candidatus Amphrikana amoebophyrae]